MRRFILYAGIIGSLLIAYTVSAAPPSRTQTYVAGEVIDPSDVTENEDNIYTYLQSGVDRIAANTVETEALKDGVVTEPKLGTNSVTSSKIVDETIVSGDVKDDTLVNADINSSAAIVDTKLAQISTASKVSGAALTSLSSIPAGAGAIPGANLSAAYPVGSIFISTSSTNPGTSLGFGTWTAFGAGRVLVGLDSGDTDFDTVEETGGAKTHTLTTDEIPAHAHNVDYRAGNPGSSQPADSTNSGTITPRDTDSAGGGAAHNNVQPYIVVYMWERTA